MSCYLKLQRSPGDGGSLPYSFRIPAPKMRTSPDRSQPEGTCLKSCCSTSRAHGSACRETQRLGLLACLATSNFKRSLPGASSSPAPKMRTSPDMLQAEGASLESCCSASSANGTARTEAQRLGLLACLTTSNFKRSPGMGIPFRAPPFAALLEKCERRQRARSQIGLAWKAVAQPNIPMALLAQRHRDWVCLLVLPSQTSNVSRGWGFAAMRLQQPCLKNANVARELAVRLG